MLSTIEPAISPTLAAAPLLQHFRYAHAAWLYSVKRTHTATRVAMTEACRAGMQCSLFSYACLPLIPFWRYDLIILTSTICDQPAMTEEAIRRARSLSTAPIVVLAPSAEQDLLVASLNAGADAVSPEWTSAQVLLAHWAALLRRRAPSHSTNSDRRWLS